MKKIVALLLAFALMCSCLAGCGQSAEPAPAVPAEEAAEPAVREFTDDLGRTVLVPETVDKIAVSGPLTQVYVFPLVLSFLWASAMLLHLI